MRLGQDVLADLRASLAAEWLLGNGLGGWASGTVAGAHTRKTHAHLVAADSDGRLSTMLLKLEEHVLAGEVAPDGGSRPANGALRASGQRQLEEFRLDPWPIWRYRVGAVTVEKALFTISGHHAVAITYAHLDGPEAQLTVSPLVVCRDPWGVRAGNVEGTASVQGMPGRVKIQTAAEAVPLTVWHSGAFVPARAWQREVHLSPGSPGEPDTGEAAFVGGYLEAPLPSGGMLHLVASAEEDLLRALAREDRLGSPPPSTLAECVAALEADERARRVQWRVSARAAAEATAGQARAARLAARPRAEAVAGGGATPEGRGEAELDPWIEPLAEALQWGLVRCGHRLTVASALPAQEVHARHELRALGGLIALRGFETVREILRGTIEYLDEGLVPEIVGDSDGRPCYGDPEPSLWLVIMGERYARRGQDSEFARRHLFPALEGVMHFYRSGSRHGIHVDSDSLLVVGEGTRAEKGAGLNALWHHALIAMAQLARSMGRKENGAFYLAWANEHQKCFCEKLWDKRHGHLYEAIGARGARSGLSPEQLFAASLTPPTLAPEQTSVLIRTIERDLFTPFGLRESPNSATVHTAWLGPFYSAYLRAHGRTDEAQARVHGWLAELGAELAAWSPGHVPATFELATGTRRPVRRADGTVSILAASELLRVVVEELDPAPAPVGN